MRLRWRKRERWCVDQVANGPDDGLNLSPASEAPAEAVRAAWAPVLSGQSIPLARERAYDDIDLCSDE